MNWILWTAISAMPTRRPVNLCSCRPIHFRAGNIRNIESPDNTYPSRISLQAQVFGSGQLTVDGKADFLAQPHAGIDAQVELTDIPLTDLLPLTGRANVILREGLLKAKGHVEYSPSVKNVQVQDFTVNNLRMDYVHAAGAAEERKAGCRGGRQASHRGSQGAEYQCAHRARADHQ